MAFGNYLIKILDTTTAQTLGDYIIPMECIALESYKVTANMRMDLDPFRDANGVLNRNVVPNQASKIEINTPYMTARAMRSLMSNIRSRYTNTSEKKVKVSFYCPDTDSYKTEDMYCPDFDFEIYQINTVDYNKTIYKPFRLAFIGY